MRIQSSVAATHKGAVRTCNEDAVLCLEDGPLFAIADGMGGDQDGLVAAQAALAVVREHMPDLRAQLSAVARERTTGNRLGLGRLIDHIFARAGSAIAQAAREQRNPQLGATLVLCMVVRNYAYIAHVGDVRAYLVRDRELIRLTEDHSVAELRLRRGRITQAEYEVSPDRHVLYQVLGAGVEVDVDLAEVRLGNGDAMLLCSDGLVRALTEDDIAASLNVERLPSSARTLIARANAAGAEDNVSVVLAAFESDAQDEPLEVVTDIMRDVFLFADLSHQERLIIAPYLEELVVPAGQNIAVEGDPADAFYVVISGWVRVTSGGIQLTDIRRGGHFGEIALARPVTRSATVRTLADTRLFSLSRSRFQALVRAKPDLGAKLALSLLDAVGDRLRELSDRIRRAESALQSR